MTDNKETQEIKLITVPAHHEQTRDFLKLLTLCHFNLQDERKSISDFEIGMTLHQCRQRIFNDLAVMQASVIFRAAKTADKFMVMYKDAVSTDERCSVRPKLKLDAKYCTLEMAWVRRIDRAKPAKASTQPVAAAHFRRHLVQTANGILAVSHYYEYLKKGLDDRYSNRIFRDQPLWAQKLGASIEDRFALLRQEQKKLSALRKNLKSLELFQDKWFSDQVKEHLKQWLSDNELEVVDFGDNPNSWLNGQIRIVNTEDLK